MSKLKLYKITTFALLLINIGILLFLWLMPHPHYGPHGELANKLGLNSKDKAIVDELEAAHHKEKRKLMEKDRKLHQQLFDEVGEKVSPEDLIQSISKNQEELERMTFEFFDTVATYYNYSQRKELEKAIKSVFMKKRHPKHK